MTGEAKIDRRRLSSRRGAILEEARRLFLAHGLHQVTTRQIAQAAGVSQPALYAHFPTRDAIAVELCRLAFAELEAVLTATAVATTGCARIRAMGQAYFAFGLKNPAAYRVAFMLEMSDARQAEKDLVLQAGLSAFGVLLEAYRAVSPDELSAAMAAQSTWASLHGLVALLLARPEFPFAPTDVLLSYHLDGIIRHCEAAGVPAPGGVA